MYNFNPYGQPGQPVRPSYNMLFSHFKQLGYSDELAGSEANRIMMQTNAYNQYTGTQTHGAQYPNSFQNVNYSTPGAQTYQFNNVYAQQASSASQNVSTPVVQQKVQSQSVSPAPQTPSLQHTTYDKSNLLSGVKLSSKPPVSGLNVPSGQSSTNTQNNLIKINLKTPQGPKSSSVGFHDGSDPPQSQQPLIQPQPVVPGYPVAQPLVTPGYQMNPQMATPYAYNQVPQPVVGNMYYQGVQFSQPLPKRQSNLSNVFYIDTKGRTGNKKANAVPSKTPMTIDQVNKWIQDLYVHLNMTTCSKKLRKAVNVYIQHILEKFRAGSLTRNDLKMLSADEIINFNPPTVAPQSVSEPDPNLEMEVDTVKSTPPIVPKGKKKMVKQKTPEEVLPKFRMDGPKGLDPYEKQRREQRSQRFKSTQNVPVYNFNLIKSKSIVGLSNELEKPYLRLTSEPNPLIVRPEKVLVKSFKYVFDKFLDNKNYVYIQEQFRSIRQDIQVQHLRSPFVVDVYTTNARLALLHNDLDQFNQCQTQLKHLLCYFQDYQLIKAEFELYYILYLSLQNMNMGLLRYLRDNYLSDSYDGLDTDSSDMSQFKNSVYFKFANAVRQSILDENFMEYFKLANTNDINYDRYLKLIYDQAFNSDSGDGSCGLDQVDQGTSGSLFYCKLLFKMFESKFRMFSLYTLCRSSLTLSPGVLVVLLNFGSENECLSFLRDHNAVFNDSSLIDCKQTLNVIIESPLMRSKKI